MQSSGNMDNGETNKPVLNEYKQEIMKVLYFSIFSALIGLNSCTDMLSTSGELCYENEEYQCAADYMTKAIQSDSLNGNLYWYRGRAYYHLEKFSKAVSDFNAAYRLGIKNDTLLNFLGDSYVKTYDYKNGYITFLLLKSQNPDYQNINYQLAVCYYYLGDIDNAIEKLKKEIESKNTYHNSFAMIGSLYNEINKYDSAVYYLNTGIKAVKSDSLLNDLHYHRGVAYFNKAEYREALADYLKSKELTTGYDEDLELKVISTYALLERHEEALKNCDSLLEIHPNDSALLNMRSHIIIEL